MFNNPFAMVVGIVLIVAVAKVFASFLEQGRARHEGSAALRGTPDTLQTEQLRDEVRQLKDRVAVLERLVTDGRAARDLASEIEDLRER